MSKQKKLQTEIDQTLKRLAVAVAEWDVLYHKHEDAEDPSQKEKWMQEMKRDLKKLQRLREQVRTWAADGVMKDDAPLQNARREIEREMERFKTLEKEIKIKAFSSAGLSRDSTDPIMVAKCGCADWLNDTVSALETQVEQFEADLEALGPQKGKGKNPRATELERCMARHRDHITRLEQVLRLLENDQVTPEEVEGALRDGLEYYLDCGSDADYHADETLYDCLPLSEVDDSVGKITAHTPRVGQRKADGGEEENGGSAGGEPGTKPGKRGGKAAKVAAAAAAAKGKAGKAGEAPASAAGSQQKGAPAAKAALAPPPGLTTAGLPSGGAPTSPPSPKPATPAAPARAGSFKAAAVAGAAMGRPPVSAASPEKPETPAQTAQVPSAGGSPAAPQAGGGGAPGAFIPLDGRPAMPAVLEAAGPVALLERSQGSGEVAGGLASPSAQRPQQPLSPSAAEASRLAERMVVQALQGLAPELPPPSHPLLLLPTSAQALPEPQQQQQQQPQQQQDLREVINQRRAAAAAAATASAAAAAAVPGPPPGLAPVCALPGALSNAASMASLSSPLATPAATPAPSAPPPPAAAAGGGFLSRPLSLALEGTGRLSVEALPPPAAAAAPLAAGASPFAAAATGAAAQSPFAVPAGHEGGAFSPRAGMLAELENHRAAAAAAAAAGLSALPDQQHGQQQPPLQHMLSYGLQQHMLPGEMAAGQLSPPESPAGPPPPQHFPAPPILPPLPLGDAGMANGEGIAAAGAAAESHGTAAVFGGLGRGGGGEWLGEEERALGEGTEEHHVYEKPWTPTLADMTLLEASVVNRPQAGDAEWMLTDGTFSSSGSSACPLRPVVTPASYPNEIHPALREEATFRRLSPETCFFAFYFQQNTRQQLFAANALKNQGWRYHTQFNAWFARQSTPKVVTETYEQGPLVYYDVNLHDVTPNTGMPTRPVFSGWCPRVSRPDFIFEYSHMENEDTTVPSD